MAIAWIFLAATGMVIARCVSINDLNKNILCTMGVGQRLKFFPYKGNFSLLRGRDGDQKFLTGAK